MNERLKTLRKTLNLTQQALADKTGIPRNNLAGYEAGTRNPSEAVIALICNTWHVNREWLENGTGEMFVDLSPKEQLSSWINEVITEQDDSFRLRLLNVLSELNEKEWGLMEELAFKLAKKEITTSANNSDTVLSAEEEYEESLGFAQNTKSSVLNTIDGKRESS